MNSFFELADMRGKVSVITGASGHLGRTAAETLASLGCNLVLLDLQLSALRELKENIQQKYDVEVEVFDVDLESENLRTNFIDEINGTRSEINSLLNIAAFVATDEIDGWISPWEEQDIHSWRRGLEVNLTAPFQLTQGLTRLLKNSNSGCVINIGSLYSELGPDWTLYEGTEMGNSASYSSSKGGLAQLTRWLSTTLAPDIRVNMISPGGIFRDQPNSFVDRFSLRTPLKRMATEDDYVGVIGFLTSDLSKYMTGQNIFVDGGWSVW